MSLSEKCKYIFAVFDVDNSGHICVSELQTMLQNWGCPREEAAEMLSKKGYAAKDNVTEDHFYNDFKDLWVFGIECLEEMARIVDQRTLKANGKIVPVQEIDGKILFDVDVASAHEGKDKGRVRSEILWQNVEGVDTPLE